MLTFGCQFGIDRVAIFPDRYCRYKDIAPGDILVNGVAVGELSAVIIDWHITQPLVQVSKPAKGDHGIVEVGAVLDEMDWLQHHIQVVSMVGS